MALFKEQFGNLIFTLDECLTTDECTALISRAEVKGWNKSAQSGGGHGRTGREDARTNQFCVFQDQALGERLWQVVRPHLQADLRHIPSNTYISSDTKGEEWTPIGVMDKMRIYKYDPGQEFPEHVDYKSGRDVVRGGCRYREQTFFTLLVYLNDDFNGGTTNYWTDHAGIHCRFLRDVEEKPAQLVIRPRTGRAVVQEQNILHEGSPTTKGTKYILRTDVIHCKQRSLHPKLARLPEYADVADTVGEWERIFEASCKNYAD